LMEVHPHSVHAKAGRALEVAMAKT